MLWTLGTTKGRGGQTPRPSSFLGADLLCDGLKILKKAAVRDGVIGPRPGDRAFPLRHRQCGHAEFLGHLPKGCAGLTANLPAPCRRGESGSAQALHQGHLPF